jgi:hypothetical protein
MRAQSRHDDIAVGLAIVHDKDAWGIIHRNRCTGTLRDVFPNFRKKLAGAVRFADIRIATCRSRFALVATEGIGGNSDDRNRPQHGICLESTRHFVSIKHRNLNVHQDEIWPLVLGHGERLLAIFSLDQFVSTIC